MYEFTNFSKGTFTTALNIAKRNAKKIAGGGSTGEVIKKLDLKNKFITLL